MAVSDDRKYTKAFVHTLLEGVKGKRPNLGSGLIWLR